MVIDDVGDNWKLRVDSALQVVKKYDSINYGKILTNCKKVSFWNGSFSTVEDSQTILIRKLFFYFFILNFFKFCVFWF